MGGKHDDETLMSAALLSTVLVTGCGGSGTETPQNPETPAAPAAAGAGNGASAAAGGANSRGSAAASTAPRRSQRRARLAGIASTACLERRATGSARAAARAPAARVPRCERAGGHGAARLSLITPVSSETAQVETPVTGSAAAAVVVDGFTVLPAGATLHGDVIEVERAGRVKGRSHLAIRFTEVEVDGQRDRFSDQSR